MTPGHMPDNLSPLLRMTVSVCPAVSHSSPDYTLNAG